MLPTHFAAERVLEAPADIVYHCLADYQDHHRPGGFLPPAFTDQHIEHGGVGAGTRIRVNMQVGGRSSTMVADITEPQPGRVLLESGPSVRTTFSVDPAGEGALVRFDTILEASNPIEALLTHLFAPRLLQPIYADELDRLERYAQALAASAGAHAPIKGQ